MSHSAVAHTFGLLNFADSPMSDSHKADPVRDLNNFLQGRPEGNLTKDFKWSSTKEGPEHDALYHVTAVCKHTIYLFVNKNSPFIRQSAV